MQPSYEQHAGYYNIRPESPKFAAKTVCSVPPEQLPELSQDESFEIFAAAEALICRHGGFLGLSEAEARDRYRYAVDYYFGDRTVRLALPTPEALTIELVESFQRELLSSYPLWRVMTLAESPETVVMIYPNAVRVGQHFVRPGLKESLAAVVSAERVLCEERDGPGLRQIEEIKRRLPEVVKQVSATLPFRIVAVFDNTTLGFDEYLVWLLHPPEEFFAQAKNSEPCRLGLTRMLFAVDDAGTMSQQGSEDPNAPFWLTQWVIPIEFGNELIVQRESDGSVWTVEFPSSGVVRDVELKKVQARLAE